MKPMSPMAEYRMKIKDLPECETVRQCCLWYLVATEGKEQDAEFDRSFIANLYDNLYWELTEEIREEEDRKREIRETIEENPNLKEIVHWIHPID